MTSCQIAAIALVPLSQKKQILGPLHSTGGRCAISALHLQQLWEAMIHFSYNLWGVQCVTNNIF